MTISGLPCRLVIGLAVLAGASAQTSTPHIPCTIEEQWDCGNSTDPCITPSWGCFHNSNGEKLCAYTGDCCGGWPECSACIAGGGAYQPQLGAAGGPGGCIYQTTVTTVTTGTSLLCPDPSKPLRPDQYAGVNCSYPDGSMLYDFNPGEHDDNVCWQMVGEVHDLTCRMVEDYLSGSEGSAPDEKDAERIPLMFQSLCCGVGRGPFGGGEDVPFPVVTGKEDRMICSGSQGIFNHPVAFRCVPVFDIVGEQQCAGERGYFGDGYDQHDTGGTERCARICGKEQDCAGFGLVNGECQFWRATDSFHTEYAYASNALCFVKRHNNTSHDPLRDEYSSFVHEDDRCRASGGVALVHRCFSEQIELLMDSQSPSPERMQWLHGYCCSPTPSWTDLPDHHWWPEDPDQHHGDGCDTMNTLCGERSIYPDASTSDVPAGMGCHDFHDQIQWHISTQEECESEHMGGGPMLWKPFHCQTVEEQLHNIQDCWQQRYWSRVCCENMEHLGGSLVKGVEVTGFACHREQSSQPWPFGQYPHGPWPQPFRRLQGRRAAKGTARRLQGHEPYGPRASPERMPGSGGHVNGEPTWVEEGPMDMLYEPNDVNGRYMFFGYANDYPLYRHTRKRELYLIHAQHGGQHGYDQYDSRWHVVLWEPGNPHPKSIASSEYGIYDYHLSDVTWPQPIQNIVCGNFRGNAHISMSRWDRVRPCVELPPRRDDDIDVDPVQCNSGLKEQRLPPEHA